MRQSGSASTSLSATSAAQQPLALPPGLPKSVSAQFDLPPRHQPRQSVSAIPFVPLQFHFVRGKAAGLTMRAMAGRSAAHCQQTKGAGTRCARGRGNGKGGRRRGAEPTGLPLEMENLTLQSHFASQLRASARLVDQQQLNEMARLKQRAERLNLYAADRQEMSERLDQPEEGGRGARMDVTFAEEPQPPLQGKLKKVKFVLPHIGLVFLSAAYTLLGAAIFHHFEAPNEMYIRNQTRQRVQLLKDRMMVQLWTLANPGAEPNWTSPALLHFAALANTGINAIIRDVFIDYTKNYMTPDEIIYGSGPTKWSFGSSVFFSWTAITTIGYGHIVPLTVQGRISCLLYALFGIPLILVTIADLARFLSQGIVRFHQFMRVFRIHCAIRLRWLLRTVLYRCCAYWRRRRRMMRAQAMSRAGGANKSMTATTIAPSESTDSCGDAVLSQAQPNHVGHHSLQQQSSQLATIQEISREMTTTDDNNNTNEGVPGASERLRMQLRMNALKRAQKRSRPPPFPPPPPLDTVSEAGTFQDVSDIRTVHGEEEDRAGTTSEDTRARADDLLEGGDSTDMDGLDMEEEVNQNLNNLRELTKSVDRERRVSVLFILVVMLGYTAGGACLMQLWERWSFMDAFYFCFVTVTTIGFGDIMPQNTDFLPATLAYIVIGLIITTMCIDLVGTEYIRDIHNYGKSLKDSLLTIGGKVIHLGEVISYVAFLQKNYGYTADQLEKLAQLPEEYLLDCLINGRQPDQNWAGGRPFIPSDIYYFKWIEQPRTLSFTSERQLASSESLDLNTSVCSTARTLTPREYYQRVMVHYCRQMQADALARTALNLNGGLPGGKGGGFRRSLIGGNR